MIWKKSGLIFKPDNMSNWMNTHAQAPTAGRIINDTCRIFFSTRDAENRSRTAYLDLYLGPKFEVIKISNKPVLDIGKTGDFDDCGAMVSSVIQSDEKIYLYYTGWNKGGTVPFRNSIGLAISYDNGDSFIKEYVGPILDRSKDDPIFCTQPTVIKEQNLWRMWYSSATTWLNTSGKLEPKYHLKYAESNDGINWTRNNHICIDYKDEKEGGIVRPAIIRDSEIYRMWFSYRGCENYRNEINRSYRIGYAESINGIDWHRMDDHAGIDLETNGWDSEMIAYPNIFYFNENYYMLYNGNEFGKTGFGIAWLEDNS